MVTTKYRVNSFTSFCPRKFMKSAIFIAILFLTLKFCYGTNDASTCPTDWSAFNGSCFKFFEMNTTWIKARISCWQLGAGSDLASVHSAEENKFLQSLLQNVSSVESSPGFWIGLLFSRSPGETVAKTFWSDDSPVDYANPDSLTPTERGPWYDGPLGRKPNNWGKIDACTLMGGNREWFDISGSSISSGFFCRKNPHKFAIQTPPVYVPKNGTSPFLWLTPLFSAFSIVLQLYVVWLVLKKSPESMRDYRFFLCANAASDIGVTIVIGFLMVLDNWMPDAIGGTVYGLGRYFGERGGQITLNMAIFAVSCQVDFQLFALFYRFTSVMAREWPKLHMRTSLKITRIIMFVFVMVTSCAVAYISKNIVCNPAVKNLRKFKLKIQESIEQMAGLDAFVQIAFTDAYLAKLPVIVLNYLNVLNIMLALIGAFVLIEIQCVIISVLIIRYLRANAHYFSAHTYRLQLQLIVSILIQLALPLVFVGIPALYVLFFSVLGIDAIKKGENLLYTFYAPSKASIQLGIFFFEFYALLNPLTIALFVTPYRRHLAKISGYRALKSVIWKSTAQKQPQIVQMMKTTQIQVDVKNT